MNLFSQISNSHIKPNDGAFNKLCEVLFKNKNIELSKLPNSEYIALFNEASWHKVLHLVLSKLNTNNTTQYIEAL